MLIKSINSSLDNINNFINNKFINDSDLEKNNLKLTNYYRDTGYYNEKRIFINLVNNNDLSNIFKNIIYNNDFYKLFNFFNKPFINNPNNDFFLYLINSNNNIDICLKKNLRFKSF